MNLNESILMRSLATIPKALCMNASCLAIFSAVYLEMCSLI